MEDVVVRTWVNARKRRWRHLTSRLFTGARFIPKVHGTVTWRERRVKARDRVFKRRIVAVHSRIARLNISSSHSGTMVHVWEVIWNVRTRPLTSNARFPLWKVGPPSSPGSRVVHVRVFQGGWSDFWMSSEICQPAEKTAQECNVSGQRACWLDPEIPVCVLVYEDELRSDWSATGENVYTTSAHQPHYCPVPLGLI